MKKALNNYQQVAVDTNIFIYYFQKHPQFGLVSKELLLILVKNGSQIITSVISLIELLSFKTTKQEITTLEHELTHIAKLEMIEVSLEITKEAASIRREYGFRLPDSIQLATAIKAKASIFITNDQRLKQFKSLKVLLISDIALGE